jgi:hypothetical protein
MRTTSVLLSLVVLSLTSAELIAAPSRRSPEARPQPRSEAHSLGKRQFCPLNNDFCVSDTGDAVCQAMDEVCCQLVTGTDPYTCPLTHPYCCGADLDTGILLCGSESTCGATDFFTAPPAIAPTETTGVAGPTKTARPAPKKTNDDDDDKPTPQQTATGAADIQRGGIAAAVLAAGVVVML